jgi:hypothetical protein
MAWWLEERDCVGSRHCPAAVAERLTGGATECVVCSAGMGSRGFCRSSPSSPTQQPSRRPQLAGQSGHGHGHGPGWILDAAVVSRI